MTTVTVWDLNVWDMVYEKKQTLSIEPKFVVIWIIVFIFGAYDSTIFSLLFSIDGDKQLEIFKEAHYMVEPW